MSAVLFIAELILTGALILGALAGANTLYSIVDTIKNPPEGDFEK